MQGMENAHRKRSGIILKSKTVSFLHTGNPDQAEHKKSEKRLYTMEK